MATETTRGLQLPCPKCGEPDANVMLSLADVSSFHCVECDEDFDRADVEAFIARWSKLLAWVDTFPA